MPAIVALAVAMMTSTVMAGAPLDPAPPPSEIVVHLNAVGGGSAPAGVGSPRQLEVLATSAEGLASLELWAEEVPVSTQTLGREVGSSLRTTLTWMPTATGETILFARASDLSGRTAQSNVLRVLVVERDEALGIGLRSAEAGETVGGIAAELGIEVDALLVANPGLEADAPLAANTDVVIPMVVVRDLAASIFADDFESGSVAAWSSAVGAGVAFGRRAAIPGPSISVLLEGCRATVEGGGSSLTDPSLALYRLDPSSSSFEPVASAFGGEASFPDDLGAGRQHYMVAAFDGRRIELSPPVAADGAAHCGSVWSDGDLRLVGGRLEVDTEAEAAYLVLFIPEEEPIRVPAAEGAFVPRGASGFDFSRHLPAVQGAEVTISAFGVLETGEIALGTTTVTATGNFPVGRILGGRATVSLAWIERPAGPGVEETLSTEGHVFDPGVLSFRWSTNSRTATHGVWQVTAYPMPAEILHPLGVLAEGVTGGPGGVFEVDFAPLLAQPATGLEIKTSPPSYETFAFPSTDPGGATDPNAVSLSPGAVEGLYLPTPNRFYVRMVPFAADQPLGLVSNDVTIGFGPKLIFLGEIVEVEEPEPGFAAYDMELGFVQKPAPPLPGYALCWKFVGWNESKKAGDPALYSVWEKAIASGAVVFCPSTSGGGGLSLPFVGDLAIAFFNGLVSLTDWISGSWVYLKGAVIDVVTQATGCTSNVCKAAASLALDTALIYFGVPPELPNFQDLVDGAKGDLSGLLVGLATDAGVPCDELATIGGLTGSGHTCQAAAAAAIDGVVDELYESMRKTANSIDGLYFPPGMMVVPDPRSQVGPAEVEVTLFTTPDSPAGLETCDVSLGLGSKWTPSPARPTLVFDPSYRETWLPASVDLVTRQPFSWWEKNFVPDVSYQGKVFEVEKRPLPEFPAGSSPWVTSRRYWIHRPAVISPIQAVWKPSPQANPKWFDLPAAALQLHQTAPAEPGARVFVSAYAPCAGFVVTTTDL